MSLQRQSRWRKRQVYLYIKFHAHIEHKKSLQIVIQILYSIFSVSVSVKVPSENVKYTMTNYMH